jgi:hypothetical protein
MTDANSKFLNSITLSTILTENTISNINSLASDSICNSSSGNGPSRLSGKLNHQEVSSLSQIDSVKVDSHLVERLNQDFIEFGFQPVLGKYTKEVNYSQLVKNSADLLQRLKHNSSQIEKVQDQYVTDFRFN